MSDWFEQVEKDSIDKMEKGLSDEVDRNLFTSEKVTIGEKAQELANSLVHGHHDDVKWQNIFVHDFFAMTKTATQRTFFMDTFTEHLDKLAEERGPTVKTVTIKNTKWLRNFTKVPEHHTSMDDVMYDIRNSVIFIAHCPDRKPFTDKTAKDLTGDPFSNRIGRLSSCLFERFIEQNIYTFQKESMMTLKFPIFTIVYNFLTYEILEYIDRDEDSVCLGMIAMFPPPLLDTIAKNKTRFSGRFTTHCFIMFPKMFSRLCAGIPRYDFYSRSDGPEPKRIDLSDVVCLPDEKNKFIMALTLGVLEFIRLIRHYTLSSYIERVADVVNTYILPFVKPEHGWKLTPEMKDMIYGKLFECYPRGVAENVDRGTRKQEILLRTLFNSSTKVLEQMEDPDLIDAFGQYIDDIRKQIKKVDADYF
ncbi:hypothetical protein AL387_gp180 [Salmon gill poxvirus]|uniref:Uncharacterized protein n=1 Tax=Salmon gill poxvirus TaxID=1680908 RepID=A0A0H4YFR7_9POXV|nr:hypothetical protein AL387_gp180 [Salmon gill poxvirus]AKR04304.1 hypothetical protein SGPV180 [Salmon gill poxvirus]